MRYFFEVRYNGSAYHGWQRQRNAVTVQQILEEHLSTLAGEKITITGSGRTDTGVHAKQQFFHADLIDPIDPSRFVVKLNSFLPKDISILEIHPVRENAHARFDAYQRTYEYVIIHHKDPFLNDFAYRFSKDLSLEKLRKGASLLVGEQDFKCFSRIKTDVNHFICNVFLADWRRDNGTLVFRISANRFLRGMVRAITGTLLDIGEGKKPVDEIRDIIKSGDRRNAGRAVPSKGLYLTEIKYPKEIFIK